MNNPERWDEPDWDHVEPVEFTGLQLNESSTFTAILLGGIILAVVLAVWHLLAG